MDKKAVLMMIAVLAAFLLIAGCTKAGSGLNPTATGRVNQTPPAGNETGAPSAPTDVLAAGDYDFKTMHGGIEREYLMHVPPSYNGSPMPVVMYLHGGGGDMGDSKQQGLYDYADRYGFILLSPDGTNRWGTQGLRTWNVGSWGTSVNDQCCGYAVEKNVDDVGFVLQMIGEVEKKVAVDTKRIYATGHSNGGGLSYRLACELSGTIAAAAPSSPAGLESSCSPSRQISIMHIHGTADQNVPFNGGSGSGLAPNVVYPPAEQEVDFWLKEDGCSGNGSVIYQKGNATCTSHSCNQGTEVEFCRVEGMGHAWPSGSPTLANVVGPVSYDISFDQIWEFFQRNPMK